MTIKRIILILFLVIALCAAKFAYDKYVGPQNAAATQQEEESRKLAELKADLYRASSSRRNTNSAPSARYKELRNSSKKGST